jgi:hypothetical protein
LRNTWSWGRTGEGYWPRGRITLADSRTLVADHPSLGRYRLGCETAPDRILVTDNETNAERLFQSPSASAYVKDGLHRLVVSGDERAVNPQNVGTKAGAWYRFDIPAGGQASVCLRLLSDVDTPSPAALFGAGDLALFERRRAEADAFFASHRDAPLTPEERAIVRQADAGLLWSRQFYHYVVQDWLEGDPAQPPPPVHRVPRNDGWRDLYARDVLSMPDTWEYPWFAAWDLAFHCVAMARIDPLFAKRGPQQDHKQHRPRVPANGRPWPCCRSRWRGSRSICR